MAYTKRNAEENRQMATMADRLVIEVGYDPSIIEDDYDDYQSHRRGCMDQVVVLMEPDFPMVGRDRIRHQVSSAMVRVYSRWVRERQGVRNGE